MKTQAPTYAFTSPIAARQDEPARTQDDEGTAAVNAPWRCTGRGGEDLHPRYTGGRFAPGRRLGPHATRLATR